MAGRDHYMLVLQPPPEQRLALMRLAKAQHADLEGESLVRLLDARYHHLTVCPVDNAIARTDRLAAIAGAAASDVPAFHLSLDRLGNLHTKRWHTWMVKPSCVPQELKKLALDLRRKLWLEGASFARGVPEIFMPHVTVSYTASAPLPEIAVPPISWTVREMALIFSHLDSASKRQHEVVARWALSGAAAPLPVTAA